jgi:nucleobase:cation symporter-1, NCS1 family
VQIAVAFYGHKFLHRFEQAMAVILLAVFAAMTIHAIQGLSTVTYVPSGGGLAGFAFMTILAASIPLSWAPYAADFSRYLPPKTAPRRIFSPAFLGMAIACAWVASLGAVLTASLGSLGDPSRVFANAFGPGLVGPLLLLLVINLLAANAPNLYSSGLSLLALDVPVKRWSSVFVGGLIATGIAMWGGPNRVDIYERWLLFIEYWIAPWAAIVLVSFFVLRPRGAEDDPGRARPWHVPALVTYFAALLVAVPFMNQSGIEGPIASAFGGLDLSNLVSFGVAAIVFYALSRREKRSAPAATERASGVSE